MQRNPAALATRRVRRSGHRRRRVRRGCRTRRGFARPANCADRARGLRRRHVCRVLQDGSRRHPLPAARGRAALARVVSRALGPAANRAASGAAAADRHSHLRPRSPGPRIPRRGRDVYDLLTLDRNSGIRDPQRQIRRSRVLSRSRLLELFPHLRTAELSGAVVFEDGQMYNPARLVLAFVSSAVAAGATACNYVEATKFLWRDSRRVRRARARSAERRRVRRSRASDAERCRPLGGLPAERPAALRRLATPALLARRLLHRRSRAHVGIRRRRSGSEPRQGCSARTRNAASVRRAVARQDAARRVAHAVSGLPDGAHVEPDEIETWIAELNAVYPALQLSPSEVSFANCGLVPFGETATATELSFGKESRLIDHRAAHGVGGLVSLVGIRFTTARADAARALELLLRQSPRAPPRRRHGAPAAAGWRTSRTSLRSNPGAAHQARGRRHGQHASVVAQSRCAVCASVAHAGPDHEVVGACIPDTTTLLAEIRHAMEHEMAMKLEDVVMRRTELAAGSHPGRRALEAAAMEMAQHLRWSDGRMREEIVGNGAHARAASCARTFGTCGAYSGWRDARDARVTDMARIACKFTRVSMSDRQTQTIDATADHRSDRLHRLAPRAARAPSSAWTCSRPGARTSPSNASVCGAARRGRAGGNRHVAGCRLGATSGARPHGRGSSGRCPARVAHAGRVFPLRQRRRRAAVAAKSAAPLRSGASSTAARWACTATLASCNWTSRATCARKIPTRRRSWQAEALVRACAHDFDTSIVRIAETYGPGDRRLLKLFRAIERGQFFMIGPGTNRRQCIHVNDLVRGLMLAARAPGGGRRNVHHGGPRSNDDERNGRTHRHGTGSQAAARAVADVAVSRCGAGAGDDAAAAAHSAAAASPAAGLLPQVVRLLDGEGAATARLHAGDRFPVRRGGHGALVSLARPACRREPRAKSHAESNRHKTMSASFFERRSSMYGPGERTHAHHRPGVHDGPPGRAHYGPCTCDDRHRGSCNRWLAQAGACRTPPRRPRRTPAEASGARRSPVRSLHPRTRRGQWRHSRGLPGA